MATKKKTPKRTSARPKTTRPSKKAAPPENAPTSSRSSTAAPAPLLEVRHAKVQVESLAISDDGALLALGYRNATVRVIEIGTGKSLLGAGVALPWEGLKWVIGLAVGASHVVAVCGGREHHVALADRSVTSRVLPGGPWAGAALRGARYAVGGVNVASGRLDSGFDGYCGMPVADAEHFGALALSADGQRIAAVRGAAATSTPCTVHLFVNDVRPNQPSSARLLTSWDRQSWRPPSLGFVGEHVMMFDGGAVHRFDSDGRERRFAWPKTFRVRDARVCDHGVYAIDVEGRVARMNGDGQVAILRTRVPGWHWGPLSADGRRLVTGSMYGALVYALTD